MTVPATNSAITKAMSVGGKLLDTRICHTNAVNYLNQVRKEVARIHINDSALAELCKWECEVGQEKLFPFDMIKLCEEVHKTRKLGRPSFRPYKYNRVRRQVPHRQDSRKSTYPQPRQRHSQKSFLGHRAPQGGGAFRPTKLPSNSS
ncbi:hypothetical protein E2C01_048222 [Portunus trituberculatus]|uniref:Uncharacterized protein n=1 Tax=Portunus trituberculatus TaxID=210409 RepID=A0A5B7G5U8_PORTR|nr:hypothetical protein [Portunus trituberculatus]